MLRYPRRRPTHCRAGRAAGWRGAATRSGGCRLARPVTERRPAGGCTTFLPWRVSPPGISRGSCAPGVGDCGVARPQALWRVSPVNSRAPRSNRWRRFTVAAPEGDGSRTPVCDPGFGGDLSTEAVEKSVDGVLRKARRLGPAGPRVGRGSRKKLPSKPTVVNPPPDCGRALTIAAGVMWSYFPMCMNTGASRWGRASGHWAW